MDAWNFAVLIAAFAAVAVCAYRLLRCAFVCRACGGIFRRALWAEHFNSDYTLIRPRCGKKGWRAAQPSEQGEGR